MFIKQHIKEFNQTRDAYPSEEELSIKGALDFLPPCLRQFLETLFCGKDTSTKVASIGQAIMQAARPRILLAPLQIGLGVQMHYMFQSKFLIDTLHHHGFSCSYGEVKKFERCSAVAQGTKIQNVSASSCLQYSADNVRSIDGRGTFHGMGIIAITPATILSRTIP